ncbi:MAG: hypothetical protein KAS72_01075 [Phycisphaerales bacterium]|nr:hypothetical protein [Phycisphaerales bacterium]
MTATQKLLVGSLMVVMLMALFLVSQYAAVPKLVPVLQGVSDAEQTAAARAMDGVGVEYTLVDGVPHVQPQRRAAVYAQLGQAGALPKDASTTFESLVEMLSPWNAKSQNDAILLGFKQHALEYTIGQMSGVRDARVMIDLPHSQGIGRAHVKATASVTLFMQGSGAVSQRFANAVASTVAGSIAGLDIENVRIIDGMTHKRFIVRGDDVASASDYLEEQIKHERNMHEKLTQFFGYIPGIRISVTAVINNNPEETSTKTYLPEGKGSVGMVTEEEKTSSTQRSAARGGEAGVNPNVGLNLGGGAGPSGETSADETKRTVFDTEVGSEVTHVFKPAGKPTQLNVAIGVPRSWFVDVYMEGQPEEASSPDDTQLGATQAQEIEAIRSVARNQAVIGDDSIAPASDVYVYMIPVSAASAGAVLGGGDFAEGQAGSMGGLLASGLVKNIALGSLAVLSLAFMFMMVRKASKPGELPTAEELIGIPPSLRIPDETVGEADEESPALAGMELDDDEVREHKILDEVTEMVKEQPQAAAAIISRWMQGNE